MRSRRRKRTAAKIAARAVTFIRVDTPPPPPPIEIVPVAGSEDALEGALAALAKKLRPWIHPGGNRS